MSVLTVPALLSSGHYLTDDVHKKGASFLQTSGHHEAKVEFTGPPRALIRKRLVAILGVFLFLGVGIFCRIFIKVPRVLPGNDPCAAAGENGTLFVENVTLCSIT